MMSILALIDSKIKCFIDGKEYCFNNGKEANSQLNDRYSIVSISVQDDYIVLKLKVIKNIESDWKEEYKEQFGEEPSFF